MTSPTVNFYSSTDANAPVLNGEPGSLITVLNACLVNGYGSKPGAGWTLLGQGTASSNPYTAMYQMGSGSKCVLYIQDNWGMNGASGTMANLSGGLPTSTWSSGLVGVFPLVNNSVAYSTNLVITKSIRASASIPVVWWIIATSNAVYIIVQPGCYFGSPYSAASLAVPSIFTFGDIFGTQINDQYPCHIQGDSSQNNTWSPYYTLCGISKIGNGYQSSSLLNLMYMATTANSLTQSPGVQKAMDQSLWYGHVNTYVNQVEQGGPGYPCNGTAINTPNSYDNGYYMCPFRLIVNGDNLRGYLPGIWAPQQQNPFPMYQVFSSPTGQFAGRSFFAVPACIWGNQAYFCNADNSNTVISNTIYGQVVFEVSSTWT